jgi:YebC/PmpR family DNA-binding regulatory protein
MAGHSHAKNVMHSKNASDAKKAKVFNKLVREIMVSAKTGMPDPAHNPRLRAAISAARVKNLPRDRIEKAIKTAREGTDTSNYESIRYEGYGPGGVALVIEALSDNRNRTAAELRSAFGKFGGALGETGSVSFMFNRYGVIAYPTTIDYDRIFEAAVEAGADDVATEDDRHEVLTSLEAFAEAREALEKAFGDPLEAELQWRPSTTASPNDDQVETLMKLVDALEDNDDVQQVFTNVELTDAQAEKLSA